MNQTMDEIKAHHYLTTRGNAETHTHTPSHTDFLKCRTA